MSPSSRPLNWHRTNEGAGFGETAQELRGLLDILDATLEPAGFLPEEGLTLADICFGPIVKRCLGFPIDTAGLDKLSAWRDAMAARPAFDKAVLG